MARLDGIFKKMKGSAGSLTFKQVNGQTVVSEKATTVKNTRTSGQQRQRTKWSNVVQMYKGIMPLINGGFEQKALRCSDFQMFMKVNMAYSNIYLTRQEVAGGACIAAPYQITQGTLPSIATVGKGENAKTDIYLGGLVIDENTTVKDFSQAVVNNNANYDYDDQISFFVVLQKVNAVTGIPYCQFAATNVILKRAGEMKLWDIVNKHGFTTSSDGFLMHSEGEGAGVYGWVHSRKGVSKTLVSTQMLIDNNAEMLAEYSGDNAYKRSVKTYGGETSAFLTPGTTATSGATPVTPGEDENGGGSSSGGSGNEDEPPLLDGDDENGGGTGSSDGGGSDGGGSDSGSDGEDMGEIV